MRTVPRLIAQSWPIAAVTAGLAMALPTVSVYAQSSLGAPLSAATGRSLADAVGQNEKELIDREVLGGPPGGVSAGRGGASSSGGAIPLNTFSTGRVRGSDHEALQSVNGSPDASNGPYPYETREYSTFGNIVVTVPGTVLGGQLKLSGFVGQNEVFLRIKSDSVHVLDPSQSGKAMNASILFGGTALWAQQNTYALATLVGTLGQSTVKDSVDDCGHSFLATATSPTGCDNNRYNFNTAGFIGTVTAGHVIDLAGKSGPKLDLRGSIGYTHNVGDTFTNVFADRQTYTFSTWTGTGGITLFTNMTLQDGALLRPYIQGYARQEWGYRNELEAVQSDGLFLGKFTYEQRHLYGGVDTGFTYTQGNTTFGAAVYYEGSGSEHTLGGRLGMSQKLDNIAVATKSRSFNWSGFYVGVNGGGSWAESRINTSAVCLDISDGFGGLPNDNLECGPATGFLTPAQLPAVNAAGTGTLSDRGFTGGVQGGYNIQTGGFVFGLELDAGSFRLGSSRSVAVPGATVVTSFDTDWLFTARTRVGLPIAPSLLVYATTGFALTDLSVGNSVTTIGAASHSGLVTGRTIGAGAEWALSRDWTLKGEYLYLNFGNVTVNSPTSLDAVRLSNDYNTVRSTADLTAQVVRMGLNYRF